VLLLGLAVLIRRTLHTPTATLADTSSGCAAENESSTPATADTLEEKTHG
jgi:hypothetical protein